MENGKIRKIATLIAKDIVSNYLTEHGFDGLWNPKEDCGCLIEDLFKPCNCFGVGCMPGYKHLLLKKDCYGRSYRIYPNKPRKKRGNSG